MTERENRFCALLGGLRALGMPTADALEASAHLENAEHPEEPRWQIWTCRTGPIYHGAPGHRCHP